MKHALELDTLRVESFEIVAADVRLDVAANPEELLSYPRICTTKFQGCP